MKKSTPKARGLILTVAIAGLVLLYTFCVFLPASKAIAAMRSSLAEKRQYILATQQANTQIGAIESELQETRRWIDEWQQNSPKRNNLGSFFGRLAEISRETGAHVERITPEELTEMNALARHPVRLVIGGTFDQQFAFVRALEQLPYTVWIDRLHLSPQSQDSERLACELSLTVFTDNRDISD